MLKEFKAFALRGNALDMAVGIIIGASFGKIVSSLVNDIIMPPLGFILGKVDFSRLAVTLYPATSTTPAVTIRYGMFINSILDFVIVAFAIFFLIKQLHNLTAKLEKPVSPTTKTCPFCCSTIALEAKKCPQCTADIS